MAAVLIHLLPSHMHLYEESKLEVTSNKHVWQSYIKRGTLMRLANGSYSVLFTKPVRELSMTYVRACAVVRCMRVCVCACVCREPAQASSLFA